MSTLTLYRRDETLQDPMGNGVSGVQVFLCNQPTDTSVIPPTNLANVYADSTGQTLLDQVTAGGVMPNGALRASQQLQTDAYGMVSYYALPGVYTVCYFSPQIATPTQTLVLADQIISTPTNLPSFNSDSSTNGTITPSPNGVQVGFTLSAAPAPPSSLILMVNGQVINAYAFADTTVVFETPPTSGSVITAIYAV